MKAKQILLVIILLSIFSLGYSMCIGHSPFYFSFTDLYFSNNYFVTTAIDNEKWLIIALVFLALLLIYCATKLYFSFVKMKVQKETLEKYIDRNIKLEQFAHLASHDLKSPLRTVISYSGLLKKNLSQAKTTTSALEYLNTIEAAALQLDELTSDFLQFARVNSMELDLTKFKTRALIQKVFDLLHLDIQKSQGEIILSNLPEYLIADKAKLQRVFHNLLSNSLKFVKAGEKPAIHIRCDQLGEFFKFSMTDNGIGIDQNFIKQIFSSFTKLHSESEYAGSGMGLAIADKLIKVHGGAIKVRSTQNNGSTFSFTVPRRGQEIQYDAKKELVLFNRAIPKLS